MCSVPSELIMTLNIPKDFIKTQQTINGPGRCCCFFEGEVKQDDIITAVTFWTALILKYYYILF